MNGPGGASPEEPPHAAPVDPDLAGLDPAARPAAAGRRRTPQRTILVVVAGAGMVGALARYAMGRLITVPSGHFPWSTFVVNATGSLVIGFVLVLLAERFPRARIARPLIATGFLGAYTTFSTYTADTDLLLRGHDLATGAIYALSSLAAGAVAVLLGVIAARLAIRLDHHLDELLG
jgi:CrcB protein